jgi:GT2 family glycosyltransferase
MKTISIIVLNYQTPQLTIDTVKSLLQITHSSFTYKIVVVNNSSKDNSFEQFTRLYKNHKIVSVFNTGANLGYVDGNNYGIKMSLEEKFDYTLVINSDVIVKPDFLSIMFDFLENNINYGLVGPKIYFAKGFEYHKDRYSPKELGKVFWSAGGLIDWNNVYGTNLGMDEVDHGQYDQINSNVDYISGCCLLIRNFVFSKIGLFDSRYFMYSEDADFSRKLINNGFKIAYLPKSIIWHVNSGSSGGGPLHDYFLTRNRLLFGFRYCPLRIKVALFRDSLRLLFFSPFVWQRRGVRDYYCRKFGKGSWK